MTASISASREPNRLYSVPVLTPARWAISSSGACRPFSRKTSMAAALSFSMLRRASARRPAFAIEPFLETERE